MWTQLQVIGTKYGKSWIIKDFQAINWEDSCDEYSESCSDVYGDENPVIQQECIGHYQSG